MDFLPFVAGFGLTLATVMMHVSAVSVVIPWIRAHAHKAEQAPGSARSALVIAGSISGLLVLQLLSALAWTCLFRLVGLAATFSDAGYLALTTISALGGDDAGATSHWRLLLPFTAINGALLFGLSTAVMFRLITLFHLAEGRQPLEDTGGVRRRTTSTAHTPSPPNEL